MMNYANSPVGTVVLIPENIHLSGRVISTAEIISCGADGSLEEERQILSVVAAKGIVQVKAGWMDPVYIIDFSSLTEIDFCTVENPVFRNSGRIFHCDRHCPDNLFELIHNANSGEIQVIRRSKRQCFLIISVCAYNQLVLR